MDNIAEMIERFKNRYENEYTLNQNFYQIFCQQRTECLTKQRVSLEAVIVAWDIMCKKISTRVLRRCRKHGIKIQPVQRESSSD
jgi:hypothetical protein